jgi:RNA-directed DNA polymerase
MNIGEMQRKLSLWATQDKDMKFFDLYHLLHDKDWLLLAHDDVKQNAGSVTAGCDGINMKTWDEHLEENQAKLAQELQSETFQPYPVRRVYIPKPHGKTRPLGIPSIKDRIVQEALRMILEPIFEADFSQYSFGFRPTRRTMDAIRYIQWSISEKKKFYWVIEGDISSYFDTIHHPKLIRLVGRRIKDKKILRLIWKFLRAGVMEKRTFRDTELGTPQGGVISPLLANIYLHAFDRYMEEHYLSLPQKEKRKRRREGLGNFTFARYADDWVVLGNGRKHQVEQCLEELSQFFKTTLRLDLSKEKTRITHINDGVKFLGFWMQRSQGQKGLTTKVVIPKEAMDKTKAKIKTALAPTSHQDSITTKIIGINRLVRGWCQYYQYTSKAASQFHELDGVVFWEMAHWLGRKFKMTMPEVMRRYNQDSTFVSGRYRLLKPTEFSSLHYQQRFFKPNPYLTQTRRLEREELPVETYWTGYEARPGIADLRLLILERDGYTCQICGANVTAPTAEVDHIRPVRRFKQPIDANVEWNLWTLCIRCHRKKTKSDRQAESRVR